jgi:hypothetical protein
MKRVGIYLLAIMGMAMEAVAAERPNMIWIEADDLMPRFMNKLGEGFGHTPDLDRLGELYPVWLNQAIRQSPE